MAVSNKALFPVPFIELSAWLMLFSHNPNPLMALILAGMQVDMAQCQPGRAARHPHFAFGIAVEQVGSVCLFARLVLKR